MDCHQADAAEQAVDLEAAFYFREERLSEVKPLTNAELWSFHAL
jgi:hypothetical protein